MSPRSLLQTDAAPGSTSGTPALLAKGFRPFFLLAAGLAVIALPAWLWMFATNADAASYLGPMYWHAHEMVFGFAVAVIAGFLLTATSNWTSRETATGPALGALVLLWLAGRVAVLFGSVLPPGLAAAIDLAFLPAVAIACARPMLATNNRRNFVFLGLLSALFLSNLGVHLGALGVSPLWLRQGSLVGVDLVVMAIVIVAGRVVPMFTRNATRVDSIKNVVWLDRAAVLSVAAVVAGDALVLGAEAQALLAAIAGVCTLARMRHWGTRHTLSQPLLWILHLGYLFVPLGLLLRAASLGTSAVPSGAALHALTAGAIGAVTIGMMTRVGLGHTGRMLSVPPRVALAFGLLLAGAALRVVASFFSGSAYVPLLSASGALWTLAFAIYLATYAAPLCRPRIDGRPG